MGKYKYVTWVNTSLTSTEKKFNSASIGASYHKYGIYKNMTEDEQGTVYNTIGLSLNISIPPTKDDADSTA